jgi:predicted dehydrogenase
LIYKCGIVGLGKAGWRLDEDPKRNILWTHANAYKVHEDTEITFVCDSFDKNIQEFKEVYGECDSYATVEDIPPVDIISIATPTKTHLSIIERIVNNRLAKAIFCEKPLAFSSTECSYIIDKCKRNGVLLAVNYMRRWDSLYVGIKELIDSNKLGRLISIVGYTNTALYMNASHMIDLIVWFGGDVASVWGSFRNYFVRIVAGREDKGGIFHFVTTNDVGGMLYAYSDSISKHQFEIDLQFSNGRVTVGSDGDWVSLSSYEDSKKITGVKELDVQLFEGPLSDRMSNAISNIIDVLKNGKRKLNCTGEDAIKSVRFIEKCYISATQGGLVG